MRRLRILLTLGVFWIAVPTLAAPPTPADLASGLSFEQPQPKLANVAIVATGGTIAEKSVPGGAAKPALSGTELIAAVEGLSKLANIGVVDFSNIDSSHMTPELWLRLSATVDAVLARSDVAGVVVTHGTDTMAEGAFFLDLTLASNKPVVFTGAMNDASSPNADGPGNIYDAVAQVISPHASDWGVTVTLNRYVNSASRARKSQTTNVQTFVSGEKGYLGYVFRGEVQRLNDRVGRRRLPRPDALPPVAYLAHFAGDDGSFVRGAVERGAKGIVVDALGAGNVNAPTAEAISHALSKGVAVVITSRVYWGAVEPSYGDVGGGADLVERGCILGGDLDGPKARLLLMLGLATHGNDRAKLAALFSLEPRSDS
jgi:L-asparaginase